MKLFEYQAKEVFKGYQIPTPVGMVIENRAELAAVLPKIGFPCVLKAQVLRGGRGKAGLIQFASSAAEATKKVEGLLVSPDNVRKILVEQAVQIERELYLAVTVDPFKARVILIACSEGGVDIETLAADAPEKIIKEEVDLNIGLMPFQARDLAYRLGLQGAVAKQAAAIITGLYQIFCQYDAELVEINPLFYTKDDTLVAGDGKLIIDGNSIFRQTRYKKTREYYVSDAEYEAAQAGIPYIQFTGDIGLMCAGAGLTTTVYDLINYQGGTVANYLEFGGPNYQKAVKAMELCLKSPSKVILIVTFGTIARADVMAEGVVKAIRKLKPDRPVVTCIRGTNEDQALKILQEEGLECLFDTEEAVRKAVELVARRDSG